MIDFSNFIFPLFSYGSSITIYDVCINLEYEYFLKMIRFFNQIYFILFALD